MFLCRGSFQDAGWRLMLTSKFAPRVRFKAACRVLLDQVRECVECITYIYCI